MHLELPNVGAAVINFNTAALTAKAVRSLEHQAALTRLVVIDNGSDAADRALLGRLLPEISIMDAGGNRGFAGGANLGIRTLLQDSSVDAILLFNSDAEAECGLVEALARALEPDAKIDLVGSVLHKAADPTQADSKGIAFYASCLASNRLDSDDPLFGPTGGCALYSRRLLAELQLAHGHVFDEDFFCYAEDTDVAARALLLGYRPRLVERPAARHVGQASSGGGFSSFVLYHGIRNSIWVVIKDVPVAILLRKLPLILAMHVGIAVRHIRRGECRTVWRLYTDAARGLPRMLKKRRAIQATRRSANEFAARISSRFYVRGSVRAALAGLVNRRVR